MESAAVAVAVAVAASSLKSPPPWSIIKLPPQQQQQQQQQLTASFHISPKFKHKQRRLQLSVSVSAHLQPDYRPSTRPTPASIHASFSLNSPASVLESGGFRSPFDDEDFILKNKSEEIEPYLNGRCIYLIGMMGSGKTTVGKVLSQALDYSFRDSDTSVEEDMNGTSVAEIFEKYGENFFRNKETEALRKLSSMHRHVISTGGGAVIRHDNWTYMQKGISVWLDVPLDALARRISAVGTNSRPLLQYESGDEYTKAFIRLSSLFEERGDAYAKANARVSLENIATKLGYEDVCSLTPTAIAIEALEQIECYLQKVGELTTSEL
ncbi:hypothetical protein ACFE04_005944 [Oxalis oulophora]